jgi:simple sugar transport system permease protein
VTEQPGASTAVIPAPPAAPRHAMLRRALRMGALRQLALLPVIVLTLMIGSQVNDSFLTWENLLTNVLGASSVLAVVTVAESLLIIAGQFDLSLQSIVGLAPMLSAWLVVPKAAGGAGVELTPVLGLVVLFGVGAATGLVNGLLVSRLRLNAFIVTLAMLILLQGLTLGISNGQTLTSLPEAYTYIGNAKWFDVPAEVWIAGIVFAAAGAFMRYHVVGREVYAIGGNVDAARAAGVRVERVILGLFITAGLLSSLAGLLLSSRIASVTASQGDNLIFTVFAAAVIGGIDLNGGRGRIVGAATGVILLGLIQNILVVSQVPSFWVSAIYGGIILLSLMLGALTGSSSLDRLVTRLRGGRGGAGEPGEPGSRDERETTTEQAPKAVAR